MKKMLTGFCLLLSLAANASVECDNTIEGYFRLGKTTGETEHLVQDLDNKILDYKNYLPYFDRRHKEILGLTKEEVEKRIDHLFEAKKVYQDQLERIYKFRSEHRAALYEFCKIEG